MSQVHLIMYELIKRIIQIANITIIKEIMKNNKNLEMALLTLCITTLDTVGVFIHGFEFRLTVAVSHPGLSIE